MLASKKGASRVRKSATLAAEAAEIQRLTDKIFAEQKELLRKLAQ